MHRKAKCTQYSAPPTHRADLLAHRQSENPMAQTTHSQPPQTLHVESEQTTSERLRKLQMQLNTPNIFVPNLVSPYASDIQLLSRCVPAFRSGLKTQDRPDPNPCTLCPSPARPVILIVIMSLLALGQGRAQARAWAENQNSTSCESEMLDISSCASLEYLYI